MLTGRITAFDAKGGWGVVATERGDTCEFHATAIASGGRTIEVGTLVAFLRVAGRGGAWEADRITPVGDNALGSRPGER